MDVVVIGAGVVGLAVAEACSASAATVTVLEAGDRIGTGISSRNSEVIHAGLYYPTGSLKASLCVEGRERLAAFCAHHGVDHRWTGKLIVATADDELPGLDRIRMQAEANGARPLLPLSAAEVRSRCPNVRGVAGLWSTGTGIVDSHGLMARLRGLTERRDGLVLCRHRVVAASRGGNGWLLRVQQPDGTVAELQTDVVVNAAGLYADAVARMVCADADLPRQIPVKGSYFDIAGAPPAQTLVYPVPSPTLTGLGTHLTLDLAGRARLGPDVQAARDLDDFAVEADRAATFHQSAARFLPGLRLDQLQPAYAGIRPKLATDRVADFYVRHEAERGLPGWINLIGIESPGLTASLALAQRVVALAQGRA